MAFGIIRRDAHWRNYKHEIDNTKHETINRVGPSDTLLREIRTPSFSVLIFSF